MYSIFVTIPSYKDQKLLNTITQLLDTSAYPDKIKFVIALQYDESFPDLSFIKPENLITIRLHPNNRPGVYMLRSMLNKFYSDEDYYLCLDSHMEFYPGWDTKLISMLDSLENKNSIIVNKAEIKPSNPNKYFYQGVKAVETPFGPSLSFYEEERDRVPGSDLQPFGYLIANAIFAPGRVQEIFSWGHGKIQAIQEQEQLTFEAFMNGWDVYLFDKERLIVHNPGGYYEKTYRYDENGMKHLADTYELKYDYLPDLVPELWKAYNENSGEFAVKFPKRDINQWKKLIGLI